MAGWLPAGASPARDTSVPRGRGTRGEGTGRENRRGQPGLTRAPGLPQARPGGAVPLDGAMGRARGERGRGPGWVAAAGVRPRSLSGARRRPGDFRGSWGTRQGEGRGGGARPRQGRGPAGGSGARTREGRPGARGRRDLHTRPRGAPARRGTGPARPRPAGAPPPLPWRPSDPAPSAAAGRRLYGASRPLERTAAAFLFAALWRAQPRPSPRAFQPGAIPVPQPTDYRDSQPPRRD